MFFVASKVGGFFLQPSLFLVTATVLGALLSLTRFRRAGRALALVSGLALGAFALTPIAVFLIEPLESRFPVPDLAVTPNPAGIIVLGGGLSAEVTRDRARLPFAPGLTIEGPIALNASGARLTEGLRLALRFPTARLVFSGGNAALVGDNLAEADVAAEFFHELGLPLVRLTIERQSRNTIENADFTKALVKPKPEETWILVTSASHMPRAFAAFEKAGFRLIAYPVEFATSGSASQYWDYTFSPIASLTLLDKAVKEWVGRVAYWFHDLL
jgi:uncharacterized SAM-binding protein YcdF (DUF218 family)